LRLEMVRAEIHSFRPDDPREKLHNVETAMNES
jgi:hypothetical protein